VHEAPAQAVAACEQARMAHADDAVLAEEMLFRRSDAELAGGDYAAAAASLDRVAALPQGDWKRLFRLERRRGMLEYRRERFAEALTHFRSARGLAEQHADATGLGQSDNDIGNALRRIGDYRGALQSYLASLDVKRGSGDAPLGPVLNNIGDLYRDLDEPDNAARYYAEALDAHRRAGHVLDAAHTLEALGVLELERHQLAPARQALQQAFATFAGADAAVDELRLCAPLARVALAAEDTAAAAEWVARGSALAREHAWPQPSELALEDARVRVARRDLDGAQRVLTAALAALPAQALERIALLEELAATQAARGQAADAYATLRAFHEADAQRRAAEHDTRLAQLRVRFEVAEKDREIRLLAAEKRLRELALRQRTVQLQLLAALVLLGLAVAALLLLRRRQRRRLAEAAREARHAAEVAHYREAAAELGLDRQRLQAALDASDDAQFVLEGGDRIAVANAAALAWLGAPATSGIGLAARVPELGAALAALDDSGQAQALAVDGWCGRLSALDAGLALLRLWPASAAAADAPADEAQRLQRYAAGLAQVTQPGGAWAAAADRHDAAEEGAAASAVSPEGDAFRRAVVELMIAALAAWERSTGSSRIELAERSRVWRVTIDEGRLRVRALERYLSLAKLPRQPRWREVLRTAYFVLAECRLEDAERDALRGGIDRVRAALRQRALG